METLYCFFFLTTNKCLPFEFVMEYLQYIYNSHANFKIQIREILKYCSNGLSIGACHFNRTIKRLSRICLELVFK